MKSDKEKNDFYEETKHRGCLQECSQILMPPGLYTGDRLPGDKKRSIPCGTDPENSKIFFVIISYWLVPYLRPHLRQPSAVPV